MTYRRFLLFLLSKPGGEITLLWWENHLSASEGPDVDFCCDFIPFSQTWVGMACVCMCLPPGVRACLDKVPSGKESFGNTLLKWLCESEGTAALLNAHLDGLPITGFLRPSVTKPVALQFVFGCTVPCELKKKNWDERRNCASESEVCFYRCMKAEGLR